MSKLPAERQRAERLLQGAKVGVFGLSLLPAVLLLIAARNDTLGADPVQTLVHETGWWGLTMLMLCLAMTPLRRLSSWSWPIRFRRMLGLYAFFYATAHLLCFAIFDLQLDLAMLGREILKRPYIAVGFSAWLLLIPLAVTSTRGMMRRLGRRWGQLHKLVYVIAVLGVVHFWWQVKADIRQPRVYAVILALLLAIRLLPQRARN